MWHHSSRCDSLENWDNLLLLTQQLLPRTGSRRNALVSLEKWIANEFARSQSIGYRVGRDAGTLSEIHAKTEQHCRAEDCLAIYMEWFPQEFMIRQSCHFERDFDRVLLQLVDVLNTQFKCQEGSWHSSLKPLNCWRKSCAKFDSLLLNIQYGTSKSEL